MVVASPPSKRGECRPNLLLSSGGERDSLPKCPFERLVLSAVGLLEHLPLFSKSLFKQKTARGSRSLSERTKLWQQFGSESLLACELPLAFRPPFSPLQITYWNSQESSYESRR